MIIYAIVARVMRVINHSMIGFEVQSTKGIQYLVL